MWEFEVNPTDEFSIEFQQGDATRARKVFEAEIAMFEAFRKQYPGVKRGLETEFHNFRKKNSDWKECLPMLLPSIMLEKDYKVKEKFKTGFAPAWPILSKWINERRWEQEFSSFSPAPNLERNVTFQTE